MDELVPASGNELFKAYLLDMVALTLASDTAITDKLKNMHQEHDLKWFYRESNMLIAPRLDKIISSNSAPPIELIDDLPDALSIESKDLRKHLILYLILMEKDGEQPRLGIGSAASQQKGAAIRIKHYKDESVFMMSKNTKKSLEEGFEITKVGVIIAVPLPKNQDARPKMRGWIITLEASSTWTFWSVWQAKEKSLDDHYMGHICPWDTRWYKGLNTHSPLSEDVVSLELTKEQLFEKVNKRREKDRLRSRAWYYSEAGYAYNKAYRNSDERKAFMRTYYQVNPQRKLASPSYIKELQTRIDGRVLVKKFEASELEVGEIDQVALEKALKLKESKVKTRDKYKDRDAEARRNSHATLRKVKAGELDGEDPDIKKITSIAVSSQKKCKKYSATHRSSINDTRRKRYAASVKALEQVEAGELDGDDPEVQKLCKVALKNRENSRKQKQAKKQAKK